MTDIGNITVRADEDVVFATAVQWSGEPGTANLAWTLDNGNAGTLEVAADTLSARLVTAADGNFEANITARDPLTNTQDTAMVTRTPSGITAIGLNATVVSKQ